MTTIDDHPAVRERDEAADEIGGAAIARRLRGESRAGTPAVTVRDMGGDGGGPWRLFIGDVGVAQWPSSPAREDPRTYAEEVARCVRMALAGPVANVEGSDVAAIRARCEAATPGPCDVHRYDQDDGSISWQIQQVGPPGDVICAISDAEIKRAKATARFLACAFVDIPALLTAFAERTRERDAWKTRAPEPTTVEALATWVEGRTWGPESIGHLIALRSWIVAERVRLAGEEGR